VTNNLWGARWSKLVANAMQNGISACTGLPGGEMLRNDPIRRFSPGSGAFRSHACRWKAPRRRDFCMDARVTPGHDEEKKRERKSWKRNADRRFTGVTRPYLSQSSEAPRASVIMLEG